MKLVKLLLVAFLCFHLVGFGQKVENFHFSIIPSVSTHGIESKKLSYHASFNLFGGKVHSIIGFELGSLYNENLGNMIGAQIAGLANITGPVKGVQIAGISNLAGNVSGVQISGIYNRAKIVRGLQIGLVNRADTVESGAVIGLINHVGKGGYRSVELHASDYQHFGITYRSGTGKLYTILSFGYSEKPERLFSGGLGLGKRIAMGKNYSIAPELVWYTYANTGFKDIRNTNAAHLRLAIMQKIYKQVAVTLTPSVYLANKEYKNGIYGYEISRFSPFGSDYNTNRQVDYGYGLSIGISFF